jgi:hypothetical protein
MKNHRVFSHARCSSLLWLLVATTALWLSTVGSAHSQTIAISSGNKQTGVVASALLQPLVVKVKNVLGAGVAGVTVNFAVASGGGSVSQISVVTNSAGTASTSLTLGTVAGANSVTAASGFGNATFTATGIAATAAKLSLSPPGTSAKAGAAVTYKATIQDAFGNKVGAASNPVSFSVTGTSASFNPASPVAPVSGIATTKLTATTAGDATVVASAAGLIGDSVALSITPGAATKLALSPASASTSIGGAVSYTATIQDAHGNTVTSAANKVPSLEAA